MLLCVNVPAFLATAVEPLWETILEAFDALTPLIDDVRPGLAFLDMRGIAGNAAEHLARARAIVKPFEMPLRFAMGANKFCAYAATWLGEDTVLEAGRERRLLAPLPIDVLDVDPAVAERLRLLGLTTLADIARLPYGPFVRRFGAASAHWHECARGIDTTPFHPRAQAIAIEASLFGEGHAEDEAQVFFALRILLARICSDLSACGKRSGALQLHLELEDMQRVEVALPLALPTADERAMLDLLRAKLEGVTFDAPIVGLRLRALRLEEGGEPLTLFCADDIDTQSVAITLARLEAALGEPARRARVRNAHPLEERFRYEPFVLTREDVRKLPDIAPVCDAGEMVPQLRLLAVREIDVRITGGAPAFVGSPPRAVLECAGPWRIEEGWFTQPVARDEYDVVLEDGDAYRIYHQGARWYLRGSYD